MVESGLHPTYMDMQLDMQLDIAGREGEAKKKPLLLGIISQLNPFSTPLVTRGASSIETFTLSPWLYTISIYLVLPARPIVRYSSVDRPPSVPVQLLLEMATSDMNGEASTSAAERLLQQHAENPLHHVTVEDAPDEDLPSVPSKKAASSIDTQSIEAFPELGAPKGKAPVNIAPIWSAKGGKSNGSTPANGTPVPRRLLLV
ncbi:RNA binding effector protein [Apiospora kogelbergensis]|uniref:RNA binding effector protein n=1 Tax=Apiospora kogelbergensis TaxID=1337665 RepID=UPI00312F06E4